MRDMRMLVQAAVLISLALGALVVPSVSAGSLISLNATLDGSILAVSANSSFASLVTTAGAGPVAGTSIIAPNIQTLASTGTNLFDRMNDGILVFPNRTPKWGIPPNATIERATVYLSKSGNASDLGHFAIVLTNGTITNESAVSTADYLKKGNLSLSNPVLDYNAGANTSFSLNSDGISSVNKTGKTTFHIQSTDMVNRSFSGTWASGGKFSQLMWYRWDDTNTGRIPRIDIYYSYPESPGTPMPKMSNAATPLNISTYDGSGQLTHPSVAYAPDGWNGYHYLMAETPYPNQSSALENPSMRYSNDKITWEQIPGQPDPIIPAPASPSTEWYSDPNIFLDGNTLYLFYRYGWATGTSGSYYNLTTSTDGVTWTPPEMVRGMNSTISGSFVKNRDGQWEAWAGDGLNPYTINHYISESPNGPYASLGKISGIVTDAPDSYWHHEFKINNGQYQALILPKIGWYGLYFFNSTNGDNWTPSEYNPTISQNIGAWDTDLYKSSFVGYEDGNYDVWYSGWKHNASYSTWKIGYTSTILFAQFTPFGPLTIWYPHGVNFADDSTGPVTAWNWSFGDGNYSTLQNPTYYWPAPGVYTVSLNASNIAVYSINSTTVIVDSTNFAATPLTGVRPLTVSFYDTVNNNATSWLWAFGDGETSALQSPSHKYSNPGSYTVNLTVYSADDSLTTSRAGYINVTGPPGVSCDNANSVTSAALVILSLIALVVVAVIVVVAIRSSGNGVGSIFELMGVFLTVIVLLVIVTYTLSAVMATTVC